MRTFKISALAASILSLCTANAEYEDYVWLKESDTTKKSSWNQLGNWDLTDFDTSKNYYVPAGLKLIPPQNIPVDSGLGSVWAGQKMVVGGELTIRFSSRRTSQPSFDDITFLGGSLLHGTLANLGLINSKVSVKASLDNPFQILQDPGSSYDETYARFDGTVFTSGSGVDSAIRFQALIPDDKTYNGFYVEKCNFENFVGTFIADGERTFLRPRSGEGGLAFGGAVIVTNGATLTGAAMDADWTAFKTLPAASLTLTEGGILKMWQKGRDICPQLALTKSLSVENMDSIQIGGATSSFGWDDLELATATVPSDNRLMIASISGPDAVRPVMPAGRVPRPLSGTTGPDTVLDWTYEVAENGSDGYEVAISPGQVVGMIKVNDSAKTELQAFTCPDDKLAEYWSDGKRPSADSTANYVCYQLLNPGSDIDLPKASLTLLSSNASYWNVDGDRVCVRQLNMINTGKAHRYSTSKGVNYNMTIEGGTLNLFGDSVQEFRVKSSRGFRIVSEITGSRPLLLGNRTVDEDADSTAVGYIDLLGYNTNYVGQLTIFNEKAFHLESENALVTQLSDSRNWGGRGSAAADAYDAITLQGLPIVNVSNDVCFAATDRSMFITNGVRFNVKSGKTLALDNQITYCGNLIKRGDGLLELGGTAAFLPGSETGNELVVEAGALKIGSKTAVDGLDVSFAAGTKLVVPRGTEGGLYNVLSENPLTFADDQLEVEIVGFDEKPKEDTEVTVCTLGAAAAASIPTSKFKFVNTTKACRIAKFEKRTVDGNVAYVATVPSKKGLVLLFR